VVPFRLNEDWALMTSPTSIAGTGSDQLAVSRAGGIAELGFRIRSIDAAVEMDDVTEVTLAICGSAKASTTMPVAGPVVAEAADLLRPRRGGTEAKQRRRQ
jgi:hypothetical protein